VRVDQVEASTLGTPPDFYCGASVRALLATTIKRVNVNGQPPSPKVIHLIADKSAEPRLRFSRVHIRNDENVHL
jgi:hypothetical protein